MSNYPCEDMRRLMEGESMKFPCKQVEENWNGGGDGSHYVVENEDGTLDKTWNEIHDAIATYGVGKVLLIYDAHIAQIIASADYDGRGSYSVSVYSSTGETSQDYFCSDADGYPEYD